jgi:hypothetical protein
VIQLFAYSACYARYLSPKEIHERNRTENVRKNLQAISSDTTENKGRKMLYSKTSHLISRHVSWRFSQIKLCWQTLVQT